MDNRKIMSNLFCFMNLKGNIVARNKIEYPYSYDPYVLHIDGYEITDDCIYSDRLSQWNHDKTKKLKEKHFGERCGDYFSKFKYNDIENFISDYLNKNIKLTAICEACNVSNGYPYWIFYFRSVEEEVEL